MNNQRVMYVRASLSFLRYHLMYSTKRYTSVNSFPVGLIYRIAQCTIILYIVGWELYLNKGYQTFAPITSAITTQMNGFEYRHENGTLLSETEQELIQKSQKFSVLDTTEFVKPPLNYNSIFIMTNFIKTEQKQGTCDEELNKPCKSDADCVELIKIPGKWNGVPTEKCVNSSRNLTMRSCQIKAWCPLEDDSYNVVNNRLSGVQNYSIFIRNKVEFKKFGKVHRNIIHSRISNEYLANCIYNERNLECPVFKISNILEKAEPNRTEREHILLNGGAIEVKIDWNCNYDFLDNCSPVYSFNRLDIDSTKSQTALGFNFRFANKYFSNKTEYRILYKAYGIKIYFNVYGIAGQFSIVPLLQKIGAGFGLMGISVFLADFLALAMAKINKTEQTSDIMLNSDLLEGRTRAERESDNLEIVRL